MNRLQELILVMLILATSLTVQYLIHLYITKFEFLPMIEGDMGGYAYIWYEKLITNHYIQLYSPSKSSSFSLYLNNPFLSIIPAIIMHILHTSNMYEGIYILYLETLVIAYISMYILIRIYLNKIYIAAFIATIYTYSPLMLGINFIPPLDVAYAMMPLAYVPLVLLFKKEQLTYPEILFCALIQLFVSLAIAWLHAEVFAIYVLIYTFSMLILIFLRKRTKKIITIGILLLISTTVGILPIISSHFFLNPLFREAFVPYRAGLHMNPYATAMNFIEFIGLCDYDSFLVLISHNYPMTLHNGYIIFTAIYALILWIPTILYTFLVRSKMGSWSRDFLIFYILALTLSTYVIYKNWGLIRLWIIENIPPLMPLSILRVFAILFKTPARLNALIAPLIFLAYAKAISFFVENVIMKKATYLSKLSKKIASSWMNKKIVVFIVLMLMILLNYLSFMIPGTFTYLHHDIRNNPYYFEWPWSTIYYIHNTLFRWNKPFHYRMLDYTVYEPHYIYLGNKFFVSFRNDLDLLELYKTPNFDSLLRDLGINYVAISNWTSYWHFVDNNLKRIFDRELSKLMEYDNITIYSASHGKAVLWLKINELKANSSMVIAIKLGNHTCMHRTNYKPLYTSSSKPLEISLHSLRSEILKHDEFTVEAVVKLNSLGVIHDQWIIVAKRNSWDNYGFGLFYGWGSNLFFNIGNWSYSIRTVIKDWNVFHKITAVYSHGVLKLYVDGVLVSQKNVRKKVVLKELTAYIGGRPEGRYKLNGTILDVEIFPYSLDPSALRIKEMKYAGNYVYVYVTNLGNVTLYNQWMKITIPILRSNETVCSVTAKVNGMVIPLQFFIEGYKHSTTISWAEIKEPMLVLGGATALSAFISINNDAFVPVFLRQLRITTALNMIHNGTPLLMVNVDPIDLYLLMTRNAIHSNKTVVVHLYEYYTPTRSALLRGFGRHYWSKPFLGVIPSDPYGTLTISPFLIYIPENIDTYTIKIHDVSIKVNPKDKYHVLLRLTVEGKNPEINIRLSMKSRTLSYRLRSLGYQFFTGWIDLGSFNPSHTRIQNIVLSLTKNNVGVYLDSIAIIPESILNDIITLNEQILNGSHSTYFVSINTLLPKKIPHMGLNENNGVPTYSGYGVLGSNVAKAYVLSSRFNKVNVSVYNPLTDNVHILLYVISASKALLNVVIRPVGMDHNTHVLNRTIQLNDITKPTWIILGNINTSSGIYKVSIILKQGRAVIGAIAMSNSIAMLTKNRNLPSGVNLFIKRDALEGTINIRLNVNRNILRPSTHIYIYVKEPYYTYKVKTSLKEIKVLPAYGIFTLIKIPITTVNAVKIEINLIPNIEPQLLYITMLVFSLICIGLILVFTIKLRFLRQRMNCDSGQVMRFGRKTQDNSFDNH